MSPVGETNDPERVTARYKVGGALAGYRLDQFLGRMIPKLSRARIQKAIASRVRLSWDAPVKPSTPVREGETVFIDDPEVNEPIVLFEPKVLFEDDDLLAIDKPPGIVVHPTHSHLHNTVITLLRRFRNEPTLTLSHRIDAETSGVLLMGRHRWAARKVQTSFERGQVCKEYRALVFGAPREDAYTVDLPLGAVSEDDFVFRQGPECDDAKPCETHFEVLERGRRFSLIRALPRSGRRHQIRAHLALTGHPIVGDKLYGLDNRAYRRYLRLGKLDSTLQDEVVAERLMLHNFRLELPRPRDPRQPLQITAPLPEDFLRIWNAG